MDARSTAADGSVRLVPFSQADPVPPVYADISDDPRQVQAGRTFEPLSPDWVTLEPGEYVDSEVAFPLRKNQLGLMALRVLFLGSEGRWRRKPLWWGRFVYIDPAELDREDSPMRERISS